MPKSLEKLFDKEFCVLMELFGVERVRNCIGRLNNIYDYTETKWWKYINGIPNGLVKYLMIAEAPPWSEDGTPQYFLDPKSGSRTLMRELRKAFFPGNDGEGLESMLNRFSECGFLLVDSIPFSMNYKRKRSNRNYNKLVGLTVRSYMINKLHKSRLSFSKDMKIIFGYKANAMAVLSALGNNIRISGTNYNIGEHLICTNRANYPGAERITAILGF